MWLLEKIAGVYCLVKGEYFFSVNNQRYGRGGRSEEKRCYADNSNRKLTKNSCLIASFLTYGLAGSFCQNLLLRTNEVEDLEILFWDWTIFFRGHLTCTTVSLSSSNTFPSINKSVTNIRANKSRVSV
jgi:hypothetical protein